MEQSYTLDSLDCALINTLSGEPDAVSCIRGSTKYPKITGCIRFYQTKIGVLVYARLSGLPHDPNSCQSRIFGFHIHSGSMCSGDANDPFSNAGTHFNPLGCPHPYHAGDLPPLFANDRFSVCIFLTDRFSVNEIIEKTIIIHSDQDDFTTNPSGNAGDKIACGIIRKCH